jgi:hypothetical protein
MDRNYVLSGLGLWAIAYVSIMTGWGAEIFFKVFGFFTLVVTYGFVVLGFWVIIIGLLRDKPYRRVRFHKRGHRGRRHRGRKHRRGR